ncbi:MAG TPA: DUF805 domain-containing protein [Pirellulales bacterium]|jgi:uncharacterized membrane protein YhaH (DUF805 family)
MATEWFYSRSGQQLGPISSKDLQELARIGKLAADDLVWKEGLQHWVPARKIKGLFPDVAAIAPRPPASPPPMPPAVEPLKPSSPDGFGFHWYVLAWKKFGDASGRARRMEYWTFILFNNLALILFSFIDGFAGTSGVLSLLYLCAALVPIAATGIRRLHDTDLSGWWILLACIPLLGIVLLVFFVRDSQPGTNKYGPNPKEAV